MVKEFVYEVYNNLSYFIGLTFENEVLWGVIPLALTTILVLIYFQKYKDEKIGWNTYLTNTLILIFVSVALYRFIYGLEGRGFYNFIDYPHKTIATTILLFVGIALLKFNFDHVFPQKITHYVSSPLTVHLTAYAIILFVHSNLNANFSVIFSLILLIVLLSGLLNISKIPLQKLFKYLEKEKKKEKLKDIKEATFELEELKKEVKERKKKLKKIKRKENSLKKDQSKILSKILPKKIK